MTKKKIAILGSTGSIGNNLLKIIDKSKKNLKIDLLKKIEKILNFLKKEKLKFILIYLIMQKNKLN